jgi:hypothetical protein
MSRYGLKLAARRAVDGCMSAPRITAATLTAAAARLAGTVVLDLADRMVGPAIYRARLAAFETIDGAPLGDDDGSLIVLVAPGRAAELIAEHGTAGRAAVVLNRELARELAELTA